MTSRASLVGDYLRARRAITQPEDVGLVRESNRRVSGLRREEVAALAGISAEYYLRLEQGRDHQPSDQVLTCLARALALDEHALEYLRKLARHSAQRNGTPRRSGRGAEQVLHRILARRSDLPAYVVDDTLDVVASTPLAAALAPSMRQGANRIVSMFTDTDRQTYPDWHTRAADMVAVLRMRADPDDPRLQALVGQMSIRDPGFAALWSRHDVHVYTSGNCFEEIAPFGTLEFEWEALVIPGYDGLTLNTLFAPEGSREAAVIAYLREDTGSAVRITGPVHESP